MSARRFGVLMLLLVGVVPLAVAGAVMIRRAADTALEGVRVGNARVAARAATRLGAYVDTQLELVRTIAASLAPAVGASPEQAERILKNYRIAFPHLRELDVVGVRCREIATSRLDGVIRERCGEPAVDEALRGAIHLSEVRLTDDFAPVMTVGLPLEIAGERFGAAVAQIDLVGIWDAVNEIHVGESGCARLVTREGVLIAHGDPEGRRDVFLRRKDPYADLIRAAGGDGARYRDHQGRAVIAVAATVPRVDWTVIVEQPESEAFAAARAMRRELLLTVLVAGAFALVFGFAAGRGPVRALEAMRRHVREVGHGNLDARVALPRLAELRSLAQALNDMAGELKRLEEEIRAKERLATFACVAASLAHDLRAPIHALRHAFALLVERGDDGGYDESASKVVLAAGKVHMPKLDRYVSDLHRLAGEGEVPIELTAVDPRALAERVIAIVATDPRWGVVEFDVAGGAARIWADESLIERAIGNLVANGADACATRKPPGGRVTVRLHDEERDAALVVEVVDTGTGIAPHVLQDVLTHEFKSTKRQGGVGLGLWVARYIATVHDGALTADSAPGVGSTFRLHLPRRADAGVSAADSQPSNNQPERGQP
jgi:signal transduction histidine kinase